MCTSDPPIPPDPGKVAKAQTGTNIASAIAEAYLNNANSTDTFGNKTTYGVSDFVKVHIPGPGGGTFENIPRFNVSQKLAPDQEKLRNLQEQAGINLGEIAVRQSDKIGNHLNREIDRSFLPNSVRTAPGSPNLTAASGLTPNLQTQIGADDFGAQRDQVVNALMSRLTPQHDRDRAALQSRLANQGVTQGSAAYNSGIDEQNRSINDARMQAVLAGGQEQSRLFGMDQQQGMFFNEATQQGVQNRLMDAEHRNQVAQNNYALNNQEAQFQQTLRQQDLQEKLSLRNQPISEITALMGGSAPTIPQFQPFQGSQIADTPVGQYYYQTAALNNQNYQNQTSQQNAAMGGMFGLGGQAMQLLGLFSDRRLKHDIKRIGKADNGLPLYTFKYEPYGPTHIGPMADEVEKVKPDAVRTFGPNDYKIVDYAKAMEPV